MKVFICTDASILIFGDLGETWFVQKYLHLGIHKYSRVPTDKQTGINKVGKSATLLAYLLNKQAGWNFSFITSKIASLVERKSKQACSSIRDFSTSEYQRTFPKSSFSSRALKMIAIRLELVKHCYLHYLPNQLIMMTSTNKQKRFLPQHSWHWIFVNRRLCPILYLTYRKRIGMM